VQHDRRPQKHAAGNTREAEEGKIQGYGRAVSQHADQRRARPSGDTQSDQGNACHPRNRYGGTSQFLTQQQPPDEQGNNQQGQSGSSFADSGENQNLFHVRLTSLIL